MYRAHREAYASALQSPSLAGAQAYADAVRAALKHYWDAERLAANPLIRSSLLDGCVSGPAGPQQRVETLRRMLLEQSRALSEAPTRTSAHRLLEATYFQPLGNQDVVAEALHLTPRTYRRHLRRAIVLLAGRLQAADGRSSLRSPGDWS